MKRYLANVGRLVIAALGIAYIVWTLTWYDHAVLPAGMTLPTGQVLVEPTDVLILDAPDPITTGSTVTVALPTAADADAATMTVTLGDEADGPQFKPGILNTLSHARVGLLVAGLLLTGLLPPIQSLRWHILMRCRGLDPGYLKSFRLNMIGLFFNLCMPGTTGGDVVKAYYAARGSGKRGTAVMSVVFDRIAGLLGLVLLAGLAGLVSLFFIDSDLLRDFTLIVWLILLGFAIAAGIYFSGRGRRWSGIAWVLDRVPEKHLLARIDKVAVAYRQHVGAVAMAVLLSLPVHMSQMLAAALAAYALGAEASLGVMLAVLPVAFFVGAMPISYQGLGVMEAAAMALLLDPPGVTANHIVGMLMLARLYVIFYALLGSLALLRGDIHLFPKTEDDAVEVPGF